MSCLRLFIVACCLALVSQSALAENVAAAQPPPKKTTHDNWPQILRDNSHSSVSPDTQLSAATASTIGINWMSALRSADLGSPVAAFNATLGITVVYVGDERGDVTAFNEKTGATVWSTSVGAGNSERSTPMVAPDGSVWVATAGDPTGVFKLNGATGAVMCSVPASIKMNSSLMVATPPGGVETVFAATNHSGVSSGVEFAINEANCSRIWSFDSWLILSGAWATPAYGVDVNGKGRVFVGTADPDSTMYSVDAVTGAPIWNYSALNPPDGTYDIGAAATVSAPGTNGFADGVVYFPSKYGVFYALDLTTGALIWQLNFSKNGAKGGRSAAALYENTLVFGTGSGVAAVNATTGTLLWQYAGPKGAEVLSSPAIAGPPGQQIVAFGDAAGLFTVLSLATGKVLYTYQTGNFITSSPAILNGHILIASSDGFLYDFVTNGANVTPPTTAITSPVKGSTLQNPGGTVSVTGSSTENAAGGVTAVQLVVQQGGPTGPWFDGATGTWTTGPFNNVVAVANPGSAQSAWTFTLPVLGSGSSYVVTANTVAAGGQVDRIGAQTSFTVAPGSGAPQLTLSTAIAPPAATFTVSGGPFAPNETVDFSLQSGPAKKAKASARGMVTNFPITVPASAEFGLSTLTAVGETSKDASSASIIISNAWAQAGYSALETGYEPNDPILENTLQATPQGYLSEAWAFDANAAVDAAPAIFGGSAYVGNAAGVLSAVDTYSGTALWTYAIPSNAPISGSPAIGNGTVVFGAADGNVYRVAAATGALLGSVTLDGVPTAPSIVGSTIYVGTDNGTVYALDEGTGNELWSYAVGASIQQSPAVDGGAGALYVGDVSGHVTKLNPSTGALIAQLTTNGAAVTVAPTISDGLVLIGAADGNLRAFSETSGSIVWKYKIGSPIHALAADGTNVYVGSNAGTIADLTLKSGSLIYLNSRLGSEIVGIGHSLGVSIATTSSGHVNAIKDNQGGRNQYNFITGGALSSQPAIVDGAVYIGAQNGNLYAFTNHGQAPIDAVVHRMFAQIRATAKTPRSWSAPRVSHHAVSATRAFAPHGPREFPLALERSPLTASPAAARGPVSAVRGATRTYVIGWAPVPPRAALFIQGARPALADFAGSAVDTAPYPRAIDDAAVQHEIEREIVANRWRTGPGTRVLVVTASSPLSAEEYCSYHSAFFANGIVTAPVVYGVVPVGTVEECGPFGPQVIRESNDVSSDPFVQAQP